MIRYEYDPDTNVIHVYAEGVLTLDDGLKYFKEILADPQIKPGAMDRVSFLNLDDLQFSFLEAQRLRDKVAEVAASGKLVRSVIVTDSELSYGIARMLQSVMDFIDYDVKVERISND